MEGTPTIESFRIGKPYSNPTTTRPLATHMARTCTATPTAELTDKDKVCFHPTPTSFSPQNPGTRALPRHLFERALVSLQLPLGHLPLLGSNEENCYHRESPRLGSPISLDYCSCPWNYRVRTIMPPPPCHPGPHRSLHRSTFEPFSNILWCPER